MVHLTLEMLLRGFANHNQPQDIDHLRRITHLQISGRDLESVESDALAACRSLTVVYLYDNRLEFVPVFKQANSTSLTHLYLQNNSISRISGLGALKCLLKLFLGGNSISVVEGLEQCSQLEELRIERQKCPPGHRLVFDPQTIVALSQSLHILDISGNKISSFVPLAQLSQLREFYAAANAVEDFRETGALLEGNWRRMEVLDLTGNPICNKNKYRERIIYLANMTLRQLDGKEVTDAQRKFVQGWHQAARGKALDEKKIKPGLPRDSKFPTAPAHWQSPQTAAQLQSESVNMRMQHSENLLSSNSIIPAMPSRNAIKHQTKHGKTSAPPHSFMHFGGGLEKPSGDHIHELSRRLDLNTSLSAKV